jgi:hypothetical protein
MGVMQRDLGASADRDTGSEAACSVQESSVFWTAQLYAGGSGARLHARAQRRARSSVIRRTPRIRDLVWVGSDIRGDWLKGTVVLSMSATAGEVVYVVELERPAPNGTRTVRARARDLTICPDLGIDFALSACRSCATDELQGCR